MLKFLFIVLTCTILTIYGCTKDEDRPRFSYLRSQLLTELFEAIKAEDSDTAGKQAERLQTLFGEDDDNALNAIIRRVRNRTLSNRLNQHISNGQPEKALTAFDMADISHRNRAVFDDYESALKDLQRLQKYLTERNQQNGRDRYEHWVELQERTEYLRECSLYQDWLQQEKGRIISKWRNLLFENIEEIIVEKGSPDIEGIVRLDIDQSLADLAQAAGEGTDLTKWHKALSSSRQEEIRNLADENPVSDDEIRCVEILAAWNWPVLDSECRGNLWELLKDRKYSSATGVRLRCMLAAEENDKKEVISYLREYIDIHNEVDKKLLRTVIPVVLLDWQQFNARPWRQPVPSFIDILERLYHLGLSGRSNS